MLAKIAVLSVTLGLASIGLLAAVPSAGAHCWVNTGFCPGHCDVTFNTWCGPCTGQCIFPDVGWRDGLLRLA